MSKNDQNVPQLDSELKKIQEQYESKSFVQIVKDTLNGLSKPKDSGEYKYAKLQVQRMSGPILAILIPVIGVGILLSIPKDTSVKVRAQTVQIEDPTETPELEDPPPEDQPEPEILEQIDTEYDGPEASFDPIDTPSDVQSNEISPKPADFNSVAIVKSPIVMRGVLGSRSPGQRGAALSKYGGNQAGEATVMRALRWLKSKQLEDGSWPGNKVSNTSLAILTFLAHGETPSPENAEFGPCVEKAIKYLCNSYNSSSKRFSGVDGNEYAHLMAVYALSEAYSMTKNPIVKEVAESACSRIVKGMYRSNLTPEQKLEGGYVQASVDGTWAYRMVYNDGYKTGDTSYAGWAAQAIKAAHTAGLEVTDLDDAYEKGALGFLLNQTDVGGFGYNKKANSGLTGVGVLCMQLMGKYDHPGVKKGLEYLGGCTFKFDDWENQPYGKSSASPIYYWYYVTQAKFQQGGSAFKAWNAQFLPELVNQQHVVKAGDSGNSIHCNNAKHSHSWSVCNVDTPYVDHEGKQHSIGYWDSPSSSGHDGGNKGGAKATRTVWDHGKPSDIDTDVASQTQTTCLCALQLMVYYRFLPSTLSVNSEAAPATTSATRNKDVSVKVSRRRNS